MKGWLNGMVYGVGKCLVWGIAILPLRWVAFLGRLMGQLAFMVDRRHRRVAVGQLAWYLKTHQREGHAIDWAREHFRRLGENYLCAIKTAHMSHQAISPHIRYSGFEVFDQETDGGSPPEWNRGWVVAIGHFGNFELYVRTMSQIQGYQGGATYRGLNQPGPDRLLRELRERSGVQFFDRRKDVESFRSFMRKGSTVMGLLADQTTGSGLELAFLGKNCKCSTAPAIMAQRYQCRLVSAICYREGPAQWHIEYGEEIPLFDQGERRPVESITREINDVFEQAIHRDPLNWFWVHDRWKAFKKKKRRPDKRRS